MVPQQNAAVPVQGTWPHTITNVEALQYTAHLANFKDGSKSKMPFDVRSLVRDALWSSCVRKTCACFCNLPCELENNKRRREKKQRKQKLLFSLSNNFTWFGQRKRRENGAEGGRSEQTSSGDYCQPCSHTVYSRLSRHLPRDKMWKIKWRYICMNNLVYIQYRPNTPDKERVELDRDFE